MAGTVLRRHLADESATEILGQDLAAALRAGDVLALNGDLGAGKTTLARALVRALADDQQLEVPSPTFTLVQAYDTRIPIQHFDLYRLAAPDELDELGFEEAISLGAVIVEWPDKAGNRLPADAIMIDIAHDGPGRSVSIAGPQAAMQRLARSFEIRAFLGRSGFASARRTYLVGDASARSYEIVEQGDMAPRVLMNSPRLVLGPPVWKGRPYAEIAHSAQSVTAFVAIGKMLKQAGFAVPEIHAEDLDQGLLLIEHLGDGVFLDDNGDPLAERYEAAARLLASLHARSWPDHAEASPGIVHPIPPFDRDAMMIEAGLLLEWYLPSIAGRAVNDDDRDRFASAWNTVLDRLAEAEISLVLRDYHSPNIIWRDDRIGNDRLGLVDFQDALIGPAAYDLASLAMDARVTVSPEIEARTFAAYVSARTAMGPFSQDDFAAAYAIMAAQRNSKILGIFVRLNVRDGKPQYLRHLPRIRDYLDRALQHPALAEVRDFYASAGLLESRTV